MAYQSQLFISLDQNAHYEIFRMSMIFPTFFFSFTIALENETSLRVGANDA